MIGLVQCMNNELQLSTINACTIGDLYQMEVGTCITAQANHLSNQHPQES